MHVVKGHFSLEQAVKTQKGSRGLATFYLKWGRWLTLTLPPPLHPKEIDPLSFVQDA